MRLPPNDLSELHMRRFLVLSASCFELNPMVMAPGPGPQQKMSKTRKNKVDVPTYPRCLKEASSILHVTYGPKGGQSNAGRRNKRARWPSRTRSTRGRPRVNKPAPGSTGCWIAFHRKWIGNPWFLSETKSWSSHRFPMEIYPRSSAPGGGIINPR